MEDFEHEYEFSLFLSLPLCKCVICQSLTSPSLFLSSADLRWNLALCSSIYQSIILFLPFLLSFFLSVVADFRHMLNLWALTELIGIKIYTHNRTLGRSTARIWMHLPPKTLGWKKTLNSLSVHSFSRSALTPTAIRWSEAALTLAWPMLVDALTMEAFDWWFGWTQESSLCLGFFWVITWCRPNIPYNSLILHLSLLVKCWILFSWLFCPQFSLLLQTFSSIFLSSPAGLGPDPNMLSLSITLRVFFFQGSAWLTHPL